MNRARSISTLPFQRARNKGIGMLAFYKHRHWVTLTWRSIKGKKSSINMIRPIFSLLEMRVLLCQVLCRRAQRDLLAIDRRSWVVALPPQVPIKASAEIPQVTAMVVKIYLIPPQQAFLVTKVAKDWGISLLEINFLVANLRSWVSISYQTTTSTRQKSTRGELKILERPWVTVSKQSPRTVMLLILTPEISLSKRRHFSVVSPFRRRI